MSIPVMLEAYVILSAIHFEDRDSFVRRMDLDVRRWHCMVHLGDEPYQSSFRVLDTPT
jgi:hypothetical protein